MEMISPISVETTMPQTLLKSRGGFAWWYVDIVNEKGDGIVMIWSFGLPFLPGYAAAARKGNPQIAGQRPSLNVAVYREGNLAFYLLQEMNEDDAHWRDSRRLVFGDSHLDIDVGTERANARLNLKVPGSPDPLRGSIEIRGSVPKIEAKNDPGEHLWGPLLVAGTGDVDLEMGEEKFEFSGDAYVDRNGSSKPLHDLGFFRWTWGRVRFRDVEKVYYVLWGRDGEAPTALGFEFSAKRTKRVELDVSFIASDQTFGGMPWFRSFKLFANGTVWLEGSCVSVVDDGPFYLRGQFVAVARGQHPRGVFEWCEPDRVDKPLHRPLVKMRVAHVGRNSMWLPLFAGSSSDRVKRLLRSWFSN